MQSRFAQFREMVHDSSLRQTQFLEDDYRWVN